MRCLSRFSGLVTGLLALASGQAAGDPSRPLHSPHELEVEIWTADESELPGLEREVVRRLQVDPKSAADHHLLSHLLIRQFSKDPSDLYVLKQAADLAQQAVDLNPKGNAGYVALADVLDLMGNGERAIRLLDEAEVAGVEPNWRFYFTRARLTADSAGTAKSLGLLETALAFRDTEPRIVVPYVVAILQGEASGAELVAKLNAWNERFPSPLFDLTTAITLTELGEFHKAHALYTKILKAEPRNKEAQVNDAIVLYRDLKDYGKGAAQLEKVLVDHVGDLSPSVKAMVTAHLGAALLAGKDYAGAEDQFLGAISLDSDNASVLDFVTRAYRNDKQHARLASLLKRVNDNVRGSGVLHALLGETLSENLANHDDALRAFADAITLDPDRSDYYNGMGLAFYRKKSYDNALKLFTTATEVDPNDATARYNEACVLSLLGRAEDALTTLTEALTLDPRLVKSARGDADFAGIKANARFQELVQEPAPGSDPRNNAEIDDEPAAPEPADTLVSPALDALDDLELPEAPQLGH